RGSRSGWIVRLLLGPYTACPAVAAGDGPRVGLSLIPGAAADVEAIHRRQFHIPVSRRARTAPYARAESEYNQRSQLMRTLMIATGDAPAQDAAGERPPAFLLPLVDRPFLQHIVEYLADTGLVEKMD